MRHTYIYLHRLFVLFMCLLIFFCLSITVILLLYKEWGKNIHIMTENGLCLMFAAGCSAKFTTAFLRMPQLEILLSQVSQDWKKIIDKSEYEILKKYNEQGRNLVIFYIFYVYTAWLVYTSIPFVPYILDKFFPLKNQTRPIFFVFYADYIIFEQIDYYYWTALHGSLVYLHCGFLFSGIDTVYVLTVKHTCGLFAIVSYRLEIGNDFEENNKPMSKINDEIVTVKALNEAIILHNETIRCCSLLEDSFSFCFLFVQSLCVVGIAVISVYLLYALDDLYTVIKGLTILGGLILHTLYLNWVGQQIINSSEKVLNSAKWYVFSLNARKLLHIIMIRSLYPSYLTAGKLSTMSMESFEKILKTAISYFTVFLSAM